jgi:hypothetical protein
MTSFVYNKEDLDDLIEYLEDKKYSIQKEQVDKLYVNRTRNWIEKANLKSTKWDKCISDSKNVTALRDLFLKLRTCARCNRDLKVVEYRKSTTLDGGATLQPVFCMDVRPCLIDQWTPHDIKMLDNWQSDIYWSNPRYKGVYSNVNHDGGNRVYCSHSCRYELMNKN